MEVLTDIKQLGRLIATKWREEQEPLTLAGLRVLQKLLAVIFMEEGILLIIPKILG